MALRLLHLHECIPQRGCRAEQPCGRLQGQEPATYSSPSIPGWATRKENGHETDRDPHRLASRRRHIHPNKRERHQRCGLVAGVTSRGGENPARFSHANTLRRRPNGAGCGSFPKSEFQHDSGSSPAVVSAAGLPCPCLRGARWSSPGGRHPFNQTGRDSADGHPILVAHSPVLSISRRAGEAAKHVRLCSGSLPEGRSPCSTARNMEHNLETPHPSSEDNHVSRRVR